VWRTLSALPALFVIDKAAFIVSLVRRRVPALASSLTPWISVFANVTYAVSIGAQLANVFGLLGGAEFGSRDPS